MSPDVAFENLHCAVLETGFQRTSQQGRGQARDRTTEVTMKLYCITDCPEVEAEPLSGPFSPPASLRCLFVLFFFFG